MNPQRRDFPAMDVLPIRFFAAAARGELLDASPDLPVHRVCTDSRDAAAGDLFVAIPGCQFDGHDYVRDALGRGAVAALVARSHAHRFAGVARITVDHPRAALGRIAAQYRSRFDLPVVAVGGSNGKTTTKDLIASILEGCFETLRSAASYNNDVGVPLTLLALESRHLAAVVEVGTNHPGELAPLLRMTRPRIGVLTQLGEEHMEYFGSMAGVVEEEGWIADVLPPDGVLVAPGDSPWLDRVLARTRARVVRVGAGSGNDWSWSDIRADLEGTTFRMRAPRADHEGAYRVNLLGAHQVSNAVMAAAVAAEFGLGPDEIARGMSRCRPPRWRMNRWQWEGVEVIEDCYNANLDSTLAALETLRAIPCAGRRVVLLGGMAELGAHTARAHTEIGRRAAELGIDRIVAVGDAAALSAEAAADAGDVHAVVVDTLEIAAETLRSFLRPGDCLLIKGSRAARLERMGALLRDPAHLQHAA